MDPSPDASGAQVRVLRIIVAAMGGGIIAFVAVATYLVESGTMRTDPTLAKFLLPVIGLLAFGEVAGYMLIRGIMVRRLHAPQPPILGPGAASTPAGSYSIVTIIGCAMAEGLGMLATVTFLLSGNRLALVAVACALVTIALQWPSVEKLERFVQQT